MSKHKKATADFVEQDQIALSSHTIKLIKWFIEHRQDELKTLLMEAHAQNEQSANHPNKPIDSIEFNETVIQLLGLFEILTQEIIEEDQSNDMFQRMLIPALKRLDGASFNPNTIEVSADKALKLSRTRHQNPRQVLFQELLRRWKPSKRTQDH